ncbi:MAG: diguanylate cyclase domain-containing protein [Vibrionaceae bacterium]
MISRFIKAMPSVSLRVKLILPIWLLITTCLISGGLTVSKLFKQQLKKSLETHTNSLGDIVASNIARPFAKSNLVEFDNKLSEVRFSPYVITARVLAANDQLLHEKLSLPQGCRITRQGPVCQDLELFVVNRNIYYDNRVLGQVVLYTANIEGQGEYQNLMKMLIVIITLFSLLSLYFARVIHSLITKPIDSLRRSMSNMISLGVQRKPLPIMHHDELGELTECFNQMVVTLSGRERELTEAFTKLEAKNSYINQILEAMHNGVAVVVPNSNITYSNPAAKALLQRVGSALENLPQLMPQMEPATAMQQLQQAIEQHKSLSNIEVTHKKTGCVFRVSTMPIATEQHSLVQFEEISMQKEAQKRRKLAEFIFDHTPNAMFVTSRSLTVQAQNKAAIEMFGKLSQLQQLAVTAKFSLAFSQIKRLLHDKLFQLDIEILSVADKRLPCRIRIEPMSLDKENKADAFVVTISDRSAALELQRLDHIAHHDSLTGLPNRIRALQKLCQLHDSNQDVHVVFLDLDGFKAINDELGHHAGDLLLQIVAKRLQACISSSDLVSRLAGDEFLLGIVGAKDISQVITRVLNKISQPIIIDGVKASVTASVGGCFWSAYDKTVLDKIIEAADKAMYEAKKLGKNCFVLSNHKPKE